MTKYNENLRQPSLFGQQVFFDALDEAELYLPQRGGYFALLSAGADGRKHQRCYPITQLGFILSHLDVRYDTWISQSVFWTHERRITNVKSISLLFLDVDYYKEEGYEWARNKSPETVALAFMSFCDNEDIPRPSLIVHSGRGIQVKWLFETPLPRPALPRWNALEKELVARFKVYGVDSAVRDAARVLRVVQTVNSRSGTICRVVGGTFDEAGRPVLYGFEYLCEFILPKTRPVKKVRNPEASPHKPIETGYSAQSLAWARLEDLRTLVNLRGGIAEGMRMNFLMYEMNFLALSGQVSPRNFYAESAVVARELDPLWDFDRGALVTVFNKMCSTLKCERIEFGGRHWVPLYTPKTQTLIDLFNVTPEEMRHLRSIVSSDIRRDRHTAKLEKARRAAGAVPRSEYEAQAARRKERARELFSQGMSKAAIAAELGIAKSTVVGYLEGQ